MSSEHNVGYYKISVFRMCRSMEFTSWEFYSLSKFSSIDIKSLITYLFLRWKWSEIFPKFVFKRHQILHILMKAAQENPRGNVREEHLAGPSFSKWCIVWKIERTETHRHTESQWQKANVGWMVLLKRPPAYVLQLCILVLLWDS